MGDPVEGCGCVRCEDGRLKARVDELEARVADLEAGIRKIIAYEWGKPEDGWEVAPIPPALPPEQKAWRELAALLPPERGGA
jgi:hypothetical protein